MAFFDGEPSLVVLRQRAIALYGNFMTLTWPSLKQLAKFLTSYCLAMKLVLDDGSRSPSWYCHCECFAREHICSGVLATKIHLREVTVPLSALAFKGRKKRGPGAPRDITRNQRYAHVEDSSSSSSSSSSSDRSDTGEESE